MASGALLLTALAPQTPLPYLLVAYGILGVGMGVVNAPITNTAVSGMPRSHAALASAVASTSRQVGASLGVALAGALAADTLAARLRDRFDAAGFFASAPKTVTLAAIEEACGSEAAARAGKLKKGELVEVAVETVVPTGWLPREIRWPGYAGPGAEQATSEAA